MYADQQAMQQQAPSHQYNTVGPSQQTTYPVASQQFSDPQYQQATMAPPTEQKQETQLISFD